MTDLKLLRLTVLSVEPGFATVEVPGTQPMRVRCPDQFTPEVGQSVLLSLVGPVPQQIIPEQIAVDAITAREIKAGSIEAEHITATAINGKTITGATIRTAAAGERFVVNEAGDNPDEIRFYPAAGAGYGKLQAGTDAVTGLAYLEMVGPQVAGDSGQIYFRSDGAGLFFGSDLATADAVVTVRQDLATMQTNTGQHVRVSTAKIQLGHNVGPVEITAPTVAFHGVTPIARRTVAAAATDLPTAVALVNELRSLLIDIGLAV